MNTTYTFQKKTVSVLTVSLLILVVGISEGCSEKKPSVSEKTETAKLVRTKEIQSEAISEPIRASGILASKEEIKLSFKIGGVLERTYVSDGAAVRKGQLLASLNLSEINSQVSQAQNAFDKADRDLKRVKNLFRDSVATLEQLQDATTGFEVAKSGLTIAKFNQQYASIIAPSNGRIQKKLAQENELISPGVPVFQMQGDRKGWVIRVGLTDRDVVRVKLGDEAEVNLDAYPTQTFKATVTEIAAISSPTTGTFDLELRVDTKGLRVFSGLIAKVTITPSLKEKLSLIPIESMMEGDGARAVVYTIENGRAIRRPIRVAFIYGNLIAVRDGLDNAQYVITDGLAYLANGDSIQIVK